MISVTPWDRRLFARAFAGALGSFLVVVLITAATDSGGTLVDRLTASLPASPFASGAGAWLAMAGARRGREAAALEVTGVAPHRARLFAWVGATLPGVLLALVVLFPRVDAGAFYPEVRSQAKWSISSDPSGSSYASDDLGVVVGIEGSLFRNDAVAPREPTSGDRAHRAAAALVLSGMAAAWALALVGDGRLRAMRVGALTVASLVIALTFQLVAADRVSLGVFVPAALFFAAGGFVLPRTWARAMVRLTSS